MPINENLDFTPAFEQGFDAWLPQQPQSLQDSMNRHLQYTPEELREDEKKRLLSVGFVAQRTRRSPEEVDRQFESFYMPAFSKDAKGLGASVSPKDANDFFEKAKSKLLDEKDERETFDKGVQAAILGEEIIPSLQSWQKENGLERMPKSTAFTKGFLQAREAGQFIDLADELLSSLEVKSGMTKDGQTPKLRGDRARALLDSYNTWSVPDTWMSKDKRDESLSGIAANDLFEEILGDLSEMTPQNRQLVYKSLGARVEAKGYDQKGFWSQMSSFLDKMIDRAGLSIGAMAANAFDYASGELLKSYGFQEGGGEVVDKETSASIAKRDTISEIIGNEIAPFVTGKLDPVKATVGWLPDELEKGLIKAPGAVLPFMVVSAATGFWGGAAVFTADFAEQNRRDLRASGMDNERARALGAAAAPLQAMVESLSNMTQLGRFPAVQRVLAPFSKPVSMGGGLFGRYVQNVGTSLALQFTEEQLQDNVIVPVLQNIAAAVDQDMPSVGFGEIWSKVKSSSPELFWTLLPMAFVFGGSMTAAQANLSAEYVENRDLMMASGASAAQANEVATQPTFEAKIQKGQEIWGKRAGTPQSMEAAAKNVTERLRQLAGDTQAMQAELERRGIHPRILHNPTTGGWTMTFPDNSKAEFATASDANASRVAFMEDQFTKLRKVEQETLLAATEGLKPGQELAVINVPEVRFARKGDENSADIQSRLEQGVALGEVTAEKAFENAESMAKAAGDEEVVARILGSSINEYYTAAGELKTVQRREAMEDVLRITTRLYEGANILTQIEETLEGHAKDLASGKTSRAWMVERLRNYEAISGDKLFASDDDPTDKQLAEAWSHIGQYYLVGRAATGGSMKGKRHLQRYLALNVWRSGLGPAMDAEAAIFGEVARRSRKIMELKAAGKLGDDLTEELERQLGIDSRDKFERDVVSDFEAIANEALNVVGASYSEEAPGPNGETFSISAATNLAESKRNDPLMQRKINKWKKSREEMGKALEEADDDFFNVFWPELMKAAGQRLKPSLRNINEAARRSVDDILGWLKENPKYLNYYADDWNTTRNILDITFPNFTNDDFVGFRLFTGLTSPATPLRGNLADAMQVMNLWQSEKSFGKLELERSAKGNRKVKDGNPFKLQSNTGANKIFTLKVIEGLFKKLGSWEAVNFYLHEGITSKELHAFNKEMGYAGGVSDIGDIRRVVNEATGQDKLIPRMFIFGPKVGAYTLNATGDSRFTTTDIWESRFIRSYFPQMFENGTGLPTNGMEHEIFQNFASAFKRTIEVKMGQDFEPSALQAVRWFYMIFKSREAGYKYGSTSGTISDYAQLAAKQYLGIDFDDNRSGGRGDVGNGSGTAGAGANVEGPTFSIRAVSPAMDAEYMAAVEKLESSIEKLGWSGPANTLRGRALRAVYESGKTPDDVWWHGSARGELDLSKPQDASYGGLWLAADAQAALPYTAIRSGQSETWDRIYAFRSFAESDSKEYQLPPRKSVAKAIFKWLEDNYPHVTDRAPNAVLDSLIETEELQANGIYDKIEVQEALEALGYDQVNSGTELLIINPVKALEKNWIQPFTFESSRVAGGTFSIRAVSPAMDAEYMAAVEAGDVAKQQAMVDAAAKAAGYDVGPVWHYGSKGIDSFQPFARETMTGDRTQDEVRRFVERARSGQMIGTMDFRAGTFFTPQRGSYASYGPQEYGVYLKIENAGRMVNGKRTADIKGQPIDALMMDMNGDGVVKEIAIIDPAKIKSADPITRDEQGNVIPLSQRFNPADNRITFSIRSGDFESRMSAAFSPFQRNPELRLAIAQVAKARAQKLGAEWIEKAAVIRSAGDIGKEARMREALAYEARMNDYMDGLTPNARQTLEFEPLALEDDPLVSAMLDFGKLMSFTNAKKAGKVDAKAGDYDGVPWLPPSFYSKGAGIMPDQMAQAMNDAGLLPDAYADTLWNELGKRIASTKKDKTAHREAVAAYKAAQKYAKDASRAEADQWAEGAKKKAGSPKAQRESLAAATRTIEGILAAAPSDVRARAGGYIGSRMAKLATDEARLKLIEGTISKLNVELEKYLKKEIHTQLDKLFERAAPKMEAGKKPKGSMTPEAHRAVMLAREAMAVAEKSMDGKRHELQQALMEPDADLAGIMEEMQVLELFGGMDAQNAESMSAALDWLSATVKDGKNRWRMLAEQRLTELRENADALQQDTGTPHDIASLQDDLANEKTVKRAAGGWAYNLISFEQVMTKLFGEDSKVARKLVDSIRQATYQRTDAVRAKRDEFIDVMRRVFGSLNYQERLWDFAQTDAETAMTVSWMKDRKETTVKVPVDTVRKIIEDRASAKALGFDDAEVISLMEQFAANDDLPGNRQKDNLTIKRLSPGTPTALKLSQNQAINLTMLARQKDYQDTLTFHGYTPEVIAEIESKLEPEAKEIRAFLARQYEDGYQSINAVFQSMYGAPLPKIANYSPGTWEALAGEAVVDPDGSGMVGGGLSASALKTRRVHRAAPRLADALVTYWQHVGTTEYFKAFAAPVRDLRGILLRPEVRAAITAKGGLAGITAAQDWVKIFENDGVKQAHSLGEIEKFQSRLQQAVSIGALAWNLGTLAKQSTAILGAYYEMPTSAYLKGFARLLRGQLEMSAIMKSDMIRRRVEAGASPELRQVMAGMLGQYPGSNQITRGGRAFATRGMEILGETDGFFTAASAAIYFDYARNEALASGMNEEQASAEAIRRTEAMVDRTAQPVEMMTRSLFENKLAATPSGKWLFMFASEARQKAALYGMAVGRIAKGNGTAADGRVMFIAHVVAPLMLQTIANMIGDWRDDDDDELFDEKNWNSMRYVKSMLLGPAMGIPLLSGPLNSILSIATGQPSYENDPTNPLGSTISKVIGGSYRLASGKGHKNDELEQGVNVMKYALQAVAAASSISPVGGGNAWLGAAGSVMDQVFDMANNILADKK
jgi:hypothetical protein